MFDVLQFAAVAAYLLWCLCAALTGVFEGKDGPDANICESDKNAPIG